MAKLGSTMTRLALSRALPRKLGVGGFGGATDRLTDIDDFGSNPGALRGRCYIPIGLSAGAPVVVVLHGCTQSAAEYDHGSGWSQLADESGFALLYPEQRRSNNPNLCFNWFAPADARRDAGEALSIHQMVGAMVDAHGIDKSRIYVTGLSAGGAMASIMLATYPDVFASGAIIAGLPFGAASSMSDALVRMRGQGYPSDAQLGALVERAADHSGQWPTISVWQGSADTTVDPSNADRITGQWRAVHGISAGTAVDDVIDGCRHRVWNDNVGRSVVEFYTIAGMGHGTPLQTHGPDACGVAGAYMLEAGISSTRRIARFWGLAENDRAGVRKADPVARASPDPLRTAPASPVKLIPVAKGVGTIIEDALRAVGLMR